MVRSIVAALMTSFAVLVSWGFVQQQEEALPGEKKQERIVIPADDENATARRDFMQQKLQITRQILEGLTLGDFEIINKAVADVQQVTQGGLWVEIDDNLYRKLTDEFKVSTERLKKAAESGNIEATALRYYEMSTRCIDCHQHMREAQYSL